MPGSVPCLYLVRQRVSYTPLPMLGKLPKKLPGDSLASHLNVGRRSTGMCATVTAFT